MLHEAQELPKVTTKSSARGGDMGDSTDTYDIAARSPLQNQEVFSGNASNSAREGPNINGGDSFRSVLNRGHQGQYQRLSIKHPGRYGQEFARCQRQRTIPQPPGRLRGTVRGTGPTTWTAPNSAAVHVVRTERTVDQPALFATLKTSGLSVLRP